MKIIYRISDTGYKKEKPAYINNENCLQNAVNIFNIESHDWTIIADNVCENTYNMITKYIPATQINMVSIGHGAGTFNLALDIALKYNTDDVVYFIENDYIHRQGAPEVILDGINMGGNYITLYDHPDKYIPAIYGGNPMIDTDGGETTKIYLGKYCHWKITNSTTMTFATTVNTLIEDEHILRKWTTGTYPQDYKLFLELQTNNKILLSSIPGYSTHGESKWLSPLTDWSKI